MPWYDYICPTCGNKETNIRKKISENVHEHLCPKCGNKMRQTLVGGRGGFELKGKGWYKSDYKK